jgi:hypothetical protein
MKQDFWKKIYKKTYLPSLNGHIKLKLNKVLFATAFPPASPNRALSYVRSDGMMKPRTSAPSVCATLSGVARPMETLKAYELELFLHIHIGQTPAG